MVSGSLVPAKRVPLTAETHLRQPAQRQRLPIQIVKACFIRARPLQEVTVVAWVVRACFGQVTSVRQGPSNG